MPWSCSTTRNSFSLVSELQFDPDAEGRVPEKRLPETINADTKGLKGRRGWLHIEIKRIGQLMAAIKNYRNQVLGMARNRVFLEPR